jgi:GT2 family glycosyltransferase
MVRRPHHSIIIPFHSNEPLLRLCLATLLKTAPSDVEKILVLNNHRTKELPRGINSTQFHIARYEESLGYSRAVNEGAALARGRTLIFCDADTFYFGDWFANLVTFHQQAKNIGLASSRLLDPRTGRVLDFGIGFTRYNAPHPHRDVRPDNPFVCKARTVQAACSANMIVDAKLFAQVGGFDAELHHGYSDLDLCLRLNKLGRKCWVVNQATVFHRGESAATGRDTYKADVKALFAAKNSKRSHPDMQGYFKESFIAFQRSQKFANGYLVIDLSSVIDRNWHHDLLREFVEVLSVYDYSPGVRDLTAISLIDQLGLNVLQSRTPILYFADRFISLKDNRMWFDMRRRKDDLVVDRNANIALLSEVVNGVC